MANQYPSAEPDTSSVPVEATDEERMIALVEVISSYIEYYHGGAVDIVSYEDDQLTVHMSGACVGCDLAPVTLHGWVEGTLKQFFPDLKSVIAV